MTKSLKSFEKWTVSQVGGVIHKTEKYSVNWEKYINFINKYCHKPPSPPFWRSSSWNQECKCKMNKNNGRKTYQKSLLNKSSIQWEICLQLEENVQLLLLIQELCKWEQKDQRKVTTFPFWIHKDVHNKENLCYGLQFPLRVYKGVLPLRWFQLLSLYTKSYGLTVQMTPFGP